MLLLPYIGLAVAAFAALFPLALALFIVTILTRDWVEDRQPGSLAAAAAYLVLVVLAVLTIAADVLFNLTWGVLLFREARSFHSWHGLPAPDLFSARVERHYRSIAYLGDWRDPDWLDLADATHQQSVAVWWARLLNHIDPGHVTMAATN